MWGALGSYDKNVCFRNCIEEPNPLDDAGRNKIKKWYMEQKENYWGRNATKALNRWKSGNEEVVDKFRQEFIKKYNVLAKKRGVDIFEE
jgi:hypothetical protein